MQTLAACTTGMQAAYVESILSLPIGAEEGLNAWVILQSQHLQRRICCVRLRRLDSLSSCRRVGSETWPVDVAYCLPCHAKLWLLAYYPANRSVCPPDAAMIRELRARPRPGEAVQVCWQRTAKRWSVTGRAVVQPWQVELCCQTPQRVRGWRSTAACQHG